MRHVASLLLCCFAAACVTPRGDAADIGETITIDPESKADASTELAVRATSLTVWMRPVATTRLEDGRAAYVLRGRASKNLDAVFPYIADDGFAAARTLSARTFEITLDGGHEINSMLSGLRLFLELDVAGSSTRYTIAIRLAPRFARFAGDGSIYVLAAIRPVMVEGGLVYRGRTRTNGGELTVSGATAGIRATGSSTLWNVDASFDTLFGAHTFALVRDGTTATKTAEVDAAIAELGITTGDPQMVWADSWDYECAAEVAACLAALPPGTTDFESCGGYRDVSRCAR